MLDRVKVQEEMKRLLLQATGEYQPTDFFDAHTEQEAIDVFLKTSQKYEDIESIADKELGLVYIKVNGYLCADYWWGEQYSFHYNGKKAANIARDKLLLAKSKLATDLERSLNMVKPSAFDIATNVTNFFARGKIPNLLACEELAKNLAETQPQPTKRTSIAWFVWLIEQYYDYYAKVQDTMPHLKKSASSFIMEYAIRFEMGLSWQDDTVLDTIESVQRMIQINNVCR